MVLSKEERTLPWSKKNSTGPSKSTKSTLLKMSPRDQVTGPNNCWKTTSGNTTISKLNLQRSRETSRKLKASRRNLTMQLLRKNKHSLQDFQRLEKLDQLLKRHTTTPDLNLNKLDSTNSLTMNTLNKSETNSTKLRTHTGRTEECWPNLLGKKPEIKPLVRILRNSKTRLLKLPRLMLQQLRHSRLTSIIR